MDFLLKLVLKLLGCWPDPDTDYIKNTASYYSCYPGQPKKQ